MFTVRSALEALLAMCPNQKFAPGKGEFYAGQAGNTPGTNTTNMRIGSLAYPALAATTTGNVYINDTGLTPISLIDVWVMEATAGGPTNQATRGMQLATVRLPQVQQFASQSGSTTTVINLPAGYTPTASSLVGLNLVGLTGVNAGVSKAISANTTSTITTSAFTSTPAVGDQFLVAGAIVDVRNSSASAVVSGDYSLQYTVYN
jgi:hypothetical protein